MDWNKYGVVDGVARDPRCENCMVHCGYDPSGALGTNYQRGDNWKNFKYNFCAAAQARIPRARKVKAFNGVSIGKGHLAEAKAAIKSGLAGAKSAFQNNGTRRAAPAAAANSERDELLDRQRGTQLLVEHSRPAETQAVCRTPWPGLSSQTHELHENPVSFSSQF